MHINSHNKIMTVPHFYDGRESTHKLYSDAHYFCYSKFFLFQTLFYQIRDFDHEVRFLYHSSSERHFSADQENFIALYFSNWDKLSQMPRI